jgi:hypothetical protein
LNTAKKTIVLAHEMLLASVGAYDSGREIVANKFDQIFVDGSELVNDLLEKGESLEAQIQTKLESQNMLRDKISALKARLGFGDESRNQQIDMLSQRVDNLIEVVAKLAQQKAAEKKNTTSASSTKKVTATITKAPVKAPVKAPAKPVAAKPAAAKSAEAKQATAKPAATKSAAVKPAAAKPAAAKPAVAKTVNAEPASKPKADDKD